MWLQFKIKKGRKVMETKLFRLCGVTGNDNFILLDVVNNYTNKHKELKFREKNFNLQTICNNNNIDITEYFNTEFNEAFMGSDSEFEVNHVVDKQYSVFKTIPNFQYNRKDINNFIYRLLIFKSDCIDNFEYNFNQYTFKEFKITKKQYIKQLYDQYKLLKNRYYNNELGNNINKLDRIILKQLIKASR